VLQDLSQLSSEITMSKCKAAAAFFTRQLTVILKHASVA
jgi:hypothetical protein